MKFKVGDYVKIKEGLTEEGTGICKEKLIEIYQNNKGIIVEIDCDNDILVKFDEFTEWYFDEDELELLKGEDYNKMKIRIKYFEGATKLNKIDKGNWIDVYSREDIFVKEGERAMIPLGFALELPQGWEGHLAPRSSTFKTWGIIQTNSVGVVDDTYIGDNDEWCMPVYCLKSKDFIDKTDNDKIKNIDLYNSEESLRNKVFGTLIHKGDKIGQFRIMEVMPEIQFEEVESFGNEDRGGFGTTGSK